MSRALSVIGESGTGLGGAVIRGTSVSGNARLFLEMRYPGEAIFMPRKLRQDSTTRHEAQCLGEVI